jgi:DNA-binding GntR family transcriptional regulator
MRRKKTAYNDLAQNIRDAITAGKWKPGSRLPTELELAGKHTVSRITVRHALQLLEEEGLIRRRPKLGTFVSSQPRRLVPVSINYTASLQLHAPDAERILLVFRKSTAGPAADLLKLSEESEVLYSERCDRLNGIPFAWDCGTIPIRYAKNLSPEDLGDVTLLERWSARENLQINSIHQTVETVTDPVGAKHLNLSAKHSLLKTTECLYDHRNRPCGIFITCYHPELVQLRIRYAGTSKIKA